MKRIAIVLLMGLVLACAGQTQHSVFDREDFKFGFFVNNTQEFVEVKINGYNEIVKPYWACVSHDRDYFEATSPKPWSNRDPQLDTEPDPRLKWVPKKLMDSSTETNAFKIYLKPGVKYTVELRHLPLVPNRRAIKTEPWQVFEITLSEDANTPFTLEYGEYP